MIDPQYQNNIKVRVRSGLYISETGKPIEDRLEERRGERENEFGEIHECADVEVLTVIALDCNGEEIAYSSWEIEETGERYTLEELLTHRCSDVRESAHLCSQEPACFNLSTK